MALEGINPDGFISISSDDESPPPKRQRLSPESSSSDGAADGDAADGTKAARLSSSTGCISDAKVSEEGEINEPETTLDHADIPSRDEADEEDKESADGALRVFLPQDPPLFVHDTVSLRLPVFSPKREGAWSTRFKGWVQVLHASNPEHTGELTPALVHAAYKQYVDCHSGLKVGKRRGAKDASAKLEDSGALAGFLKSLQSPATVQAPENGVGPAATVDGADGENGVGRAVSTAQSNGPKEEPGVSRREGVPTGEAALAQQRRYFPSASDPTTMCLLCGRQGHVATDCRGSSCTFCSKDDHWDFVCPRMPTRCRKCNQLGHAAATCVEKLLLSKEEGLACVYCKLPGHVEDECTEPWRSYAPLSDVVKTVAHLAPSCAGCGAGQHYSGDCPHRPPSQPVNPTWTLRNRSLYMDPASESTAIEASSYEQGVGRARPTDLKIRGHASRTHIRYESEDSDDVEFLGQQAAARRPRLGQIRVASNIQMPGATARQPPLPPGPPPPPVTSLSRYPPAPGTHSHAFLQGPPPSLPSKPPPRNYQSVPPPPAFAGMNSPRGGYAGGRGGARGRGGRGGRGRGRGMGK